MFDKEKKKQKGRLWRAANKESERNRNLQSKHGIGQDEYEILVLKQKGLCAICFNPPEDKPLYIDHCHSSNKIRGLLCRNCNLGLGLFKDTPTLLRQAATYIEEQDLISDGDICRLLNRWKSRAREIELSGSASDALCVYGMRILIEELSQALKEDSSVVPEQSQPNSEPDIAQLSSKTYGLRDSGQYERLLVPDGAKLQMYNGVNVVPYPDTLPDATGDSSDTEVTSPSQSQEVWQTLSGESKVREWHSHPAKVEPEKIES